MELKAKVKSKARAKTKAKAKAKAKPKEKARSTGLPAARPFTRTLFIVRHAHRDKPNGDSGDDGLSVKGLKQRERLTTELRRELKGFRGIHFATSPMKRCRETIDVLAKGKARATELLSLNASSSDAKFQKVCEEFMGQWLTSESRVWVASLHGEWIEKFFKRYDGVSRELKKGRWIRVDFSVRTQAEK